jgi:hypothetical protein
MDDFKLIKKWKKKSGKEIRWLISTEECSLKRENKQLLRGCGKSRYILTYERKSKKVFLFRLIAHILINSSSFCVSNFS